MESISTRILFEDNHLIAVNKKAGELSQGDITGDKILADEVKQYIKEKYGKPGDVFLGIPHRLDRPVSGVILFARTSKALERLTIMFRDKKIEKTYWALVHTNEKLVEGTLKHYLKRLPNKNVTKAYDNEVKESKESILKYTALKQIGKYALLEVKPITGRQHQIRVQLAAIGSSIVGDLKYGYPKANKDASICLHARQLDLIHPVRKEPIVIKAKLPDIPEWKLI